MAPCSARSCSRRSSATRPCARLSERARRKLEVRIRALLEEERARYTDLLVSLGIDPASADRVRNAARTVDDLRYAGTGRARNALPLGS